MEAWPSGLRHRTYNPARAKCVVVRCTLRGFKSHRFRRSASLLLCNNGNASASPNKSRYLEAVSCSGAAVPCTGGSPPGDAEALPLSLSFQPCHPSWGVEYVIPLRTICQMSRARRHSRQSKRAAKERRKKRQGRVFGRLRSVKVGDLFRRRWKLITPVVAVLALAVWMLVPGGGAVDIDTEPGLGWATWESRDSEERLVFPSGTVEGTDTLRWEARDESGIGAVVLITGHHPSAVLGLWNKLYRVDSVAFGEEEAWRMRARITVNLPLGRDYEAEWFRNMMGRRLEIMVMGNPLKAKRVLTIKRVSFGRKVVDIVQDGNVTEKRQMFEAIVDASESVPRALYNSTFGFLTRNNVSTFLGSLVAAVLAGLIVRGFPRRRSGGPGSLD